MAICTRDGIDDTCTLNGFRLVERMADDFIYESPGGDFCARIRTESDGGLSVRRLSPEYYPNSEVRFCAVDRDVDLGYELRHLGARPVVGC